MCVEKFQRVKKNCQGFTVGDFEWHVPRREKKVVWLEKNKLDGNC